MQLNKLPALSMSIKFFYIANGRIHLKEEGQPARLIESRFGASLIDRVERIRERNAWKTQGSGAQFMSGRMLWGDDNASRDAVAGTQAVTGISRGVQDGEFLYSLATDEVTGVFALRRQASEEQRLFHTADYRISQLDALPSQDRVACAIQHKGICNIAVMRGDGSDLTDVTQGDSIDRAPSWVPGRTNELVYQSSGIARDKNGVGVGAGPASVQRLNIDTGEIAALLEDAEHDYLDPRMDAEGNLYCIRKPYISLRPRLNIFRVLLDLVLFPFRLFFALFQFLNFFTVRYTGKTLVTSGNARQKQADIRKMMMLGNLFQAEREAALSKDNEEGLVAKSWELVKRAATGEVEVVQRGVLSFDLCGDGGLLFTDGSSVFLVSINGKKETLVKDAFIFQVLAAPSL
jgi:hypothetical protein